MSKLAEVLGEDSLYPHPERLVPFIGNHDTERFATAAGSEGSVKLALAYVLTTRGMAQIYSGDEIAMQGGGDPENRHDFPGGFRGSIRRSDAFTAAGRTPVQQQTFAGWRSLMLCGRSMMRWVAGRSRCLRVMMIGWCICAMQDGRWREVVGRRVSACWWRFIGRGRLRVRSLRLLDVKLGMTWMQGCRLGAAEVHTGDAAAVVQGEICCI